MPDNVRELCAAIADCLHRTGCLVVRVPGVDEALHDTFLDLMERYFEQPDEDKLADVRPELSYQVGATPSGVETPRCLVDPVCGGTMAALGAGHRAAPVTGADVKWRYFWRVGPRPADGQYMELNADPVVPKVGGSAGLGWPLLLVGRLLGV